MLSHIKFNNIFLDIFFKFFAYNCISPLVYSLAFPAHVLTFVNSSSYWNKYPYCNAHRVPRLHILHNCRGPEGRCLDRCDPNRHYDRSGYLCHYQGHPRCGRTGRGFSEELRQRTNRVA